MSDPDQKPERPLQFIEELPVTEEPVLTTYEMLGIDFGDHQRRLREMRCEENLTRDGHYTQGPPELQQYPIGPPRQMDYMYPVELPGSYIKLDGVLSDFRRLKLAIGGAVTEGTVVGEQEDSAQEVVAPAPDSVGEQELANEERFGGKFDHHPEHGGEI